MQPGSVIFIAVSIALIVAFTAYNIWTMRRQARLMRTLNKMLEDAEAKQTSKLLPKKGLESVPVSRPEGD